MLLLALDFTFPSCEIKRKDAVVLEDGRSCSHHLPLGKYVGRVSTGVTTARRGFVLNTALRLGSDGNAFSASTSVHRGHRPRTRQPNLAWTVSFFDGLLLSFTDDYEK